MLHITMIGSKTFCMTFPVAHKYIAVFRVETVLLANVGEELNRICVCCENMGFGVCTVPGLYPVCTASIFDRSWLCHFDTNKSIVTTPAAMPTPTIPRKDLIHNLLLPNNGVNAHIRGSRPCSYEHERVGLRTTDTVKHTAFGNDCFSSLITRALCGDSLLNFDTHLRFLLLVIFRQIPIGYDPHKVCNIVMRGCVPIDLNILKISLNSPTSPDNPRQPFRIPPMSVSHGNSELSSILSCTKCALPMFNKFHQASSSTFHILGADHIQQSLKLCPSDLDLDDMPEEKKADDYREALDFMKEALGEGVDEVRISRKLKTHPVCMTSGEGMSFEMERYFNAVQPEMGMKAKRILEVRTIPPSPPWRPRGPAIRRRRRSTLRY